MPQDLGSGEEGMGVCGYPAVQPLCLPVKILPDGSCGGRSRADACERVCCGYRGVLVYGESSECRYVHERGQVFVYGIWMDVVCV